MTPAHLGFALFQPYAGTVRHAIFTRHGGVSVAPFHSLNVSYSVGDVMESVAENRRRCAAALGISLPALITAGLVHGACVANVAAVPADTLPDGSRIVRDVDALITDQPENGLLITAADCLQVLLFDPRRPAIGLAHAGWRGLVANVLGATVQAMEDAYGSDPSALVAGIGPGLGPCCARFSDPARELPERFKRYVRDRHVDLWTAAHDQLRAAGMRAAHIEQQAICTVCRRDRFFSHRGDQGRTGRFAAIIALTG
ncbi:MAG TPA: polyphenol oxidase family protein [Chloroflexota bacterium]|nr:polyphenol oxidase family protein [Chloroflexota bacterium]